MIAETTSPEEILAARRYANTSYIALLVALARDHGMSMAGLAEWVQRPYEELGLYAELSRVDPTERLRFAAIRFANGRRLLYDEVTLGPAGKGWRVTSHVWYAAHPPESLALTGLAPADLREYGAVLATRQLALQGITVTFDNTADLEVATLRVTEAD